MNLEPNNTQVEVFNAGAKLRALKAGESEKVQTAIDNIIVLHKKQNESLAQYQFGDTIYDQLNANYSVLLTAENPELKTIANDYLYDPMNEQMAPTRPASPVSGKVGGRRNKRKTIRRRRRATMKQRQRKTGRRNRRS
jgi:hypothetical protein